MPRRTVAQASVGSAPRARCAPPTPLSPRRRGQPGPRRSGLSDPRHRRRARVRAHGLRLRLRRRLLRSAQPGLSTRRRQLHARRPRRRRQRPPPRQRSRRPRLRRRSPRQSSLVRQPPRPGLALPRRDRLRLLVVSRRSELPTRRALVRGTRAARACSIARSRVVPLGKSLERRVRRCRRHPGSDPPRRRAPMGRRFVDLSGPTSAPAHVRACPPRAAMGQRFVARTAAAGRLVPARVTARTPARPGHRSATPLGRGAPQPPRPRSSGGSRSISSSVGQLDRPPVAEALVALVGGPVGRPVGAVPVGARRCAVALSGALAWPRRRRFRRAVRGRPGAASALARQPGTVFGRARTSVTRVGGASSTVKTSTRAAPVARGGLVAARCPRAGGPRPS